MDGCMNASTSPSTTFDNLIDCEFRFPCLLSTFLIFKSASDFCIFVLYPYHLDNYVPDIYEQLTFFTRDSIGRLDNVCLQIFEPYLGNPSLNYSIRRCHHIILITEAFQCFKKKKLVTQYALCIDDIKLFISTVNRPKLNIVTMI